MVERYLAKVQVAGSNPVSRSKFRSTMFTRYTSLSLLMRANEAYFYLCDLCQNIASYVYERGWDWWHQEVAFAQQEARRLEIAACVGHE